MEGKDILLGLISIGSAVVAGYSIYKLREAQKKIDDGVEKISEAVGEIDISDTIIEDAVTRAVEKNAKLASANAVVQVKHDILQEVRKSVDDAYEDTQAEVKKELEKQIGEVDLKDIRKKVIDEASEKAQEKFSSDLDDILQQYNKKLDDVGKIYDSIAKSLEARKAADGMTLKIGG